MTVHTFFHSLQVHMGYTAKLTIRQVAKQASTTFKRCNQSEDVSDNTDIKSEINNNDMVLYIKNAKDAIRKLLQKSFFKNKVEEYKANIQKYYISIH